MSNKNKSRLIKRLITGAMCLTLVFSINGFASVVSDNDGSAFITKAEFDSLKNTFQSQIDQYNQSIDSKIDGAIAAYLAGLQLTTRHEEAVWNSSDWQNGIYSLGSAYKSTELYNPGYAAINRIVYFVRNELSGYSPGYGSSVQRISCIPIAGHALSIREKDLGGKYLFEGRSVITEAFDIYQVQYVVSGNYSGMLPNQNYDGSVWGVASTSNENKTVHIVGLDWKFYRSSRGYGDANTYCMTWKADPGTITAKVTNANVTAAVIDNRSLCVMQNYDDKDFFHSDYKDNYLRGSNSQNEKDRVQEDSMTNSTEEQTIGWPYAVMKQINAEATTSYDAYGRENTSSTGAFSNWSNEKGQIWTRGGTFNLASHRYVYRPGAGMYNGAIATDNLITDNYANYIETIGSDGTVEINTKKYLKLLAGIPLIELKAGNKYSFSMNFDPAPVHYLYLSMQPLFGTYTSWNLMDIQNLTKDTDNNAYKLTENTVDVSFTAPANGVLWIKFSDTQQAKGGGRAYITEKCVIEEQN